MSWYGQVLIATHWRWTVFSVALVICTVAVALKRQVNTNRSDSESNFLENFSLIGSILIGAVFAAIFTLIFGLFF